MFSKVHPCFSKWQNFVLFYVWVILHYVTHTHTHTHVFSIRQPYLSSRIFILYLFECYFSPLLLFFPFDTHLTGILETLILVSILIKFHPPLHFCPLISMCDVLGEFLRLTFQVTNSLFDNIQPRAYAIYDALIPMNTFQFQDLRCSFSYHPFLIHTILSKYTYFKVKIFGDYFSFNWTQFHFPIAKFTVAVSQC